jgi:hypothetical protein
MGRIETRDRRAGGSGQDGDGRPPDHATEWAGDPEKRRDVIERFVKAMLEINKLDLAPKEARRLVDEKIKEALKEMKEADIAPTSTPPFGDWPPPPASKN